ncbi:hypothetical protein B0H10DRAFT_599114 [Mycena sp. CBHHK59/15]|nr:hypothetical protein B0H10DRAFT_599114 [Mycena sp. CBHHK59/15]
MEPVEFIGIIAGGLLFVLILTLLVVYVHRRSKRQMMAGEFDKSAFSVVSLTHPRPPLPSNTPSPRSSLIDREAQKQELVGREVQQQEQTYMQLMAALQTRPGSRTGTLPLPNQAPRVPYHAHWMVQIPTARDPTEIALPQSPLTAYPVGSAPPPVTMLAVSTATASNRGASQLKRGLSVRSIESASEYSVASAPRDPQEHAYQPFALAPIPASPKTPVTPKWPSSPGSYAWPKRQRASLIRTELAPETYSKVRWKVGDDAEEPEVSTPTALALPPTKSMSPPSAPMTPLRINVPPPVHYRAISDSHDASVEFYANASASSSSPTLPDPSQPPRSPRRQF